MANYIYELRELKDKAPKLFGIKTGTKLDEMFFTVDFDEERKVPRKRILNGIPYLSVMNIVGVPDTGKSVLAEQFAVKQASLGYKVLFVTTETPANFIYTSLRSRAYALGVDFDSIIDNFIIIDATENSDIRQNVTSAKAAMAEAISKKKTTITVIDSITGFYEHRELSAREVVRDIFNFLKNWKQTALLISQKRSSQNSDSADAAGGLAVAHIVDGTIVMAKKIITSKYEEGLYGVPIGDVLRTIRIDGCRVAGHETATYVMKITDLGLIEIKEPLSLRTHRPGGM